MGLQIKICGLTRLEDAIKAIELGADFLGFILYAKSPRSITPESLRALTGKLPADAQTVGVFVNSNIEDVLTIVKDCRLSAVQFHGDEDLRTIPQMDVPVWKAVRVAPGATELPPDVDLADRIVLDTSVEGLYGGTGRQIDLEAAAAVAIKRQVMLGGGLTPANVTEAIAKVNPLGVDVASGVESTPGIKDHSRLEAFIKAARSA